MYKGSSIFKIFIFTVFLVFSNQNLFSNLFYYNPFKDSGENLGQMVKRSIGPLVHNSITDYFGQKNRAWLLGLSSEEFKTAQVILSLIENILYLQHTEELDKKEALQLSQKIRELSQKIEDRQVNLEEKQNELKRLEQNVGQNVLRWIHEELVRRNKEKRIDSSKSMQLWLQEKFLR